MATCESYFGTRTNDEMIAMLTANDVACGPVRFVDELLDNEQVTANGYIEEYEHTLLGPMRGPRPVVQMSGTPTRIQRASPALGEHTLEVLGSLGFSENELDRLESLGVISSGS